MKRWESAFEEQLGYPQRELRLTWGLGQAIRKTDGNQDEFFTTVEEILTAKEIQVSDMFIKILAVIQAHTEQNEAQSERIQTQFQAQSEQIAVVQRQLQAHL